MESELKSILSISAIGEPNDGEIGLKFAFGFGFGFGFCSREDVLPDMWFGNSESISLVFVA